MNLFFTQSETLQSHQEDKEINSVQAPKYFLFW